MSVASRTMTSEDAVQHLLTDGVETVEVREDLERKLRSGRQLRVKMGFDPSAPDIHLGHYVGLRKLRQFQDLGHKVIIIVGDWTAQIGDPSGRSAQRNMMSPEQVNANAQTYLDQFFKVVDADPDKVEVRWQSSWFGTFDLADVLRLTSRFTVAQMLARDDFHARYTSGSSIAIMEFLYPLLQAYDSVAVQSDVEMGGTDQTFNLLVGRDIQREMGQEPQDILTVPLLVGTDGVQKMSKSLGNYVGITEPANEMYGKLMSIPDSILETYLRLVSTFSPAEIDDMLRRIENDNVNPRDVKSDMATNVVSILHGEAAAEEAKQEFDRVFRERQTPTDIPEIDVSVPATVVTILRTVEFAKSNGEARRLVQQGGVRVDGEKVTDPDSELTFDSPVILQAGRRRFVRLVPSVS